MKVYPIPASPTSKALKGTLLQELSLRVDTDGNGSDIQVIIFLPVSRPWDDFKGVIDLFEEQGGQIKDPTVLITALKPSDKEFEVPNKGLFAHTARVNIADGGNLDSSSGDAVDDLADVLVEKYNFKRTNKVRKVCAKTSLNREAPSGDKNSELLQELRDVRTMKDYVAQRKIDLQKELREVQKKNSDLQKELNEVREENRTMTKEQNRLNSTIKEEWSKNQKLEKERGGLTEKVKEKQSKNQQLEDEIVGLRKKVKEERSKNQQLEVEMGALTEKVKEEQSKNQQLETEMVALKEAVDERNDQMQQLERDKHELTEKSANKDAKIRELEEKLKEGHRQRQCQRRTGPDSTEIITAGSIPFTYQRGPLEWIRYWIVCCFCCCWWCFGSFVENDKDKVVDGDAVKAMERSMTGSNYKIQRSYEKQLHLEPGKLKIILEDLLQTLKTQSTGESSESRMENLGKKYGLSEENLNDLLSEVYRQGKEG